MTIPSQHELEQALRDAGSAHHDYEQVILKGKPDELWAGFYAALVLGRLGNFTTSSTLSQWLSKAPSGDNWVISATTYLLSQLKE